MGIPLIGYPHFYRYTMRNILILDLSSVLHSVKFSLGKHKLTHKEQPTFVMYGFLNSLYAYQNKVKPDIIVVACDSRTSLRKELYPLYKHKRQKKTPEQAALDKIALPQFETIRYELLPELGCRNIFGVDDLEADDVIGRLCKMRIYKNDYITIATTDKDIYQCLRHNVRIINSKNKTFYTLKDFTRDYGIEPKMWKRVKAYGGCTSDCVKGLPIPDSVKCIGEGYALKFVKGELPEHYKAYKAFIVPENKKILQLNKELVILPHKSTPDFKIRPNHFSRKGLVAICKRYGFESILSMRKDWFSLLRMK